MADCLHNSSPVRNGRDVDTLIYNVHVTVLASFSIAIVLFHSRYHLYAYRDYYAERSRTIQRDPR